MSYVPTTDPERRAMLDAIGVANFDAVRAAFGESKASRAVYALVGASGAYAVVRGRQLTRH